MSIPELGTYSRCFFRNISFLFINSQKMLVRLTEVFIPLNIWNICPVSIYLWAIWLDFFVVCGEWQACCRSHPSYPNVGDLKCIAWNLQENCSFFPHFFTDSNRRHTQWGQVIGLQCGHLCLYRSILHQEKRWLFLLQQIWFLFPSLSWQTKHLVKGKVKPEAKSTGRNYFGVRINLAVR